MKKFLTLLLTVIMSVSLLASCGDPVYDDFENFLNNEMTDVNANYEKIKAEAATWENLDIEADETALETSISDVLLPIVNDSLEKLGKIEPETDDVKAVKDKYVKVMEAYKAGFDDILAGLQSLDEDKILAGNDEINNAITLLEEYNTALDALAEKVGAKIEY